MKIEKFYTFPLSQLKIKAMNRFSRKQKLLKKKNYKVKCVSTKNKQDFAIFFKNGFGIYGDMDVLLKLDFHQKGQNFARDAIEASGAQKIL